MQNICKRCYLTLLLCAYAFHAVLTSSLVCLLRPCTRIPFFKLIWFSFSSTFLSLPSKCVHIFVRLCNAVQISHQNVCPKIVWSLFEPLHKCKLNEEKKKQFERKRSAAAKRSFTIASHALQFTTNHSLVNDWVIKDSDASDTSCASHFSSSVGCSLISTFQRKEIAFRTLNEL